MRAARCWGALLLVLALAGCAATPESRPARSARSSAEPAPPAGATLACGTRKVHVGHAPAGLSRGAKFTRIKALTRRFKVKGVEFTGDEGAIKVGVVCGVRSAEQFATLVTRSHLTMYKGRPALRWRTRGDVRNFMWLDRPGTAVYIAATPDLASQIAPVAAAITVG